MLPRHNHSDPIDAHLRELECRLRAPRGVRRRILAEARAHLLDAAEAERADTSDGTAAAERAVARFGFANETADQFNQLAAGRRMLRRTLAPLLAAAALTSMATASVWAVEPGPTRRHGVEHASLSHPVRARPHRPLPDALGKSLTPALGSR